MNRFWKSGDPFVWLTGGALALSLIMVAGLVYLVLAYGLGFFWPSEILRLTLKDGTVLLGELADREKIPQPGAASGTLDRYRIKLKVGNRDLYGADFTWVDEDTIDKREAPANAVLIERREWGTSTGRSEVKRRPNRRARSRGGLGRRQAAVKYPPRPFASEGRDRRSTPSGSGCCGGWVAGIASGPRLSGQRSLPIAGEPIHEAVAQLGSMRATV
jgi:hypothetical protein